MQVAEYLNEQHRAGSPVSWSDEWPQALANQTKLSLVVGQAGRGGYQNAKEARLNTHTNLLIFHPQHQRPCCCCGCSFAPQQS